MKTIISHSSLFAAVLLAVVGCHTATKSSTQPAAPTKFYLGADISALAGGRGGFGRGPRVYQENGQEDTEFAIMIKHGWNAFRLRVFVSPVRMAPNNSLENTIALAKQIKDAGATFMLDIHYSDTWADPQHQETPVAWRNLDVVGLEKQVEEYSKDVITQFRDAGAMPDMVQVGNEITGGMLWPLGYVKVPPSEVKLDAGQIRGPFPDPYDEAKQWDNLTRLIKAGVRGVRAGAADKPVQIIMHIDCGGDWPVTQWWFDHLTDAKVDYDIIGQSFYPRWHGNLTLLQQNMLQTTRRYGKPIMIVETGYSQSGGEQVMTANKYNLWPGSQEGQLQFMVDLVNTIQRAGGTGCFYWAPEGSRGNGLWNPDGSPAPATFVLDNLDKLKTAPASRMPPAPAPEESVEGAVAFARLVKKAIGQAFDDTRSSVPSLIDDFWKRDLRSYELFAVNQGLIDQINDDEMLTFLRGRGVQLVPKEILTSDNLIAYLRWKKLGTEASYAWLDLTKNSPDFIRAVLDWQAIRKERGSEFIPTYYLLHYAQLATKRDGEVWADIFKVSFTSLGEHDDNKKLLMLMSLVPRMTGNLKEIEPPAIERFAFLAEEAAERKDTSQPYRQVLLLALVHANFSAKRYAEVAKWAKDLMPPSAGLFLSCASQIMAGDADAAAAALAELEKAAPTDKERLDFCRELIRQLREKRQEPSTVPPVPAISVLDNLTKLMSSPASRLPAAPTP